MRVQAYARDPIPGVVVGEDLSIAVVNSSVLERGAQANVAAETETQLLSHTVAGTPLFLDEINCTGTGAAVFRVYVDGAHKETKRYAGGYAPLEFKYPPHRLAVGAVVAVKVTHHQAGKAYDYEATLKGHR